MLSAAPDLSAFVGLPWRDRGRTRDGVDCWGLGVVLYAEQLGIGLPSYADDYLDEATARDLARVIGAGKRTWRAVSPDTVQCYDGVLLRCEGDESHIGWVVEPGQMLHILVGQTSRLERYTSPTWCRRVTGFYRHADL